MNPTPINQSGLKLYKRSPAHYRYFTDNPPAQTAVQAFGEVYHMYILQTEMFSKHYLIYSINDRPEPEKTMASKANKEWLEGLQSDGRQMIERGQLDVFYQMGAILDRDPIASKLLSGGAVEQRFDLPDLNGCPVHGRPDVYTDKIICDLKTVQSAAPEDVQRTAYTSGWHIQAAFYIDCLRELDGKERQFVFVCQEREAQYLHSVHIASEQMIAYGRYEYEQLLQLHISCCRAERWPGYEVRIPEGINELHLPAWAVKEKFYEVV